MSTIDAELDELAHQVVDAAFRVHSTLGPGLMENIYEHCMMHELTKRRIRFQQQMEVPVVYDGLRVGIGFRVDLFVGNRLVVELKTVDRLSDLHRAQLLTYMKLLNQCLGLLINFNVPVIRQGIVRMAL